MKKRSEKSTSTSENRKCIEYSCVLTWYRNNKGGKNMEKEGHCKVNMGNITYKVEKEKSKRQKESQYYEEM